VFPSYFEIRSKMGRPGAHGRAFLCPISIVAVCEKISANSVEIR
jgi:hypothetical protein